MRSPNEKAGFGAVGTGFSFVSGGGLSRELVCLCFNRKPARSGYSRFTYVDFIAAWAAFLSAFVVPSFFDAELRAPKKTVGLGRAIGAFGRGGAGAVDGFPFWIPSVTRLIGPLETDDNFAESLRLDVTTIRLVAG